MARIGVLALQGAFERHARVIERIGHTAVLARTRGDLADVDGLVLPGGESTVQLDLLARFELEPALVELARSGRPILATCAGLILIASRVSQLGQRSLDLLDVGVARNAWGRQVDSFEADSDEGRPLVFIRAPRITDVGAGVDVLARFQGEPVLVRKGRIVAATFHPELTDDTWVHEMTFEA